MTVTSHLVSFYLTFSPLPSASGQLRQMPYGGYFLLADPTVANSFYFRKRSTLCCPDFPLVELTTSDKTVQLSLFPSTFINAKLLIKNRNCKLFGYKTTFISYQLVFFCTINAVSDIAPSGFHCISPLFQVFHIPRLNLPCHHPQDQDLLCGQHIL